MSTSIQKSFSLGKEYHKKLYIIATPIGNLDEVSFRLIETLKDSELIVCENIRSCLKILKKFSIANKKMITYNNISEKSSYLVNKTLEVMMNYDKVSLVSCAGYPLVSDPGRLIVKGWIENGFHVVPISGPSAFLNALVSSGFYFHNFVFLGFLPRTKSKQQRILKSYKENYTSALVIYESPLRTIETLKNLKEFIGNRMVAVCREITKVHEEFIRGDIESIINSFYEKKFLLKGEIVIVVSVDLHNESFVEKRLTFKKK